MANLINNPQDDLENSLNKFVAHTKPGAGEVYNNVCVSTAFLGMESVVDTVEGRAAFQRDLKLLEKWAAVCFMKSSEVIKTCIWGRLTRCSISDWVVGRK